MASTFTLDALQQAARAALQKKATPGAAFAVLVDGQPVISSAAGYARQDQSAPLDPAARFPIYSITKTLIAAVTLQLAEQDRLRLDAPVQAYLPALALPAPVTLRQLLNHTGGVPDYGGLSAYFDAVRAHPAQPWSAQEFLAATLPAGLAYPPGQGWGYSNIGYLLLRQVIETVTGASLREALRERIFAPLGLRHTDTAETLEDMQPLTPGYSQFFSPGELQDVRSRYHPGWVSHGVVLSTAAELAHMLDAILGGRLLSAESRAAMLKAEDVPVQHPFFHRPAYGLGVMVDKEPANGLIAGHGGGGPGYSAGALTLVDTRGRRITGAVLANSDRDDLALRLAYDLLMQAAQG